MTFKTLTSIARVNDETFTFPSGVSVVTDLLDGREVRSVVEAPHSLPFLPLVRWSTRSIASTHLRKIIVPQSIIGSLIMMSSPKYHILKSPIY